MQNSTPVPNCFGVIYLFGNSMMQKMFQSWLRQLQLKFNYSLEMQSVSGVFTVTNAEFRNDTDGPENVFLSRAF